MRVLVTSHSQEELSLAIPAFARRGSATLGNHRRRHIRWATIVSRNINKVAVVVPCLIHLSNIPIILSRRPQ